MLELLVRQLVGGVEPTEFGHDPWARVIAHIGNHAPTAADTVVATYATPLDLNSSANAYWPRSWAGRALAYVGDERAAPALVRALADRHWRVRMAASQTIGRLRICGLEAELLPLLEDAHPRVRAAVELAIERTAVAGAREPQETARSRRGCVARYHRSMTEDSGWSVIPSIRVPDMQTAIEFYTVVLGFTLDRSEPTGDNSSLHRGSARIMLEVPSKHFSDAYNQAIRERLGSVSAMALYIEARDLEALYGRVRDAGVTIVDPLAYRPWKQHEFTIEDHVGNWLTFWNAPQKTLL